MDNIYKKEKVRKLYKNFFFFGCPWKHKSKKKKKKKYMFGTIF